MITRSEIESIVKQCTYKQGWSINVHCDASRGDALYIQVSVSEDVGICSVTGKPVAWVGGKKYLSPYMCKQEIVGAVFAIIKAAEEHEMLENFRYKGASIFNPHLSPDALAELAKKKANFVTRPNNTSMTLKEPNEL